MALALLGTGNGLFAVSMNGTALDWEQATRRSVISLLHGAFSAAAVAGALGTASLLAAGWGPARVLIILGLLAGGLMVPALFATFPHDDASGATCAPVSTLGILVSTGALRLLALATILGAVAESVANVWSVIFLHERGASIMTGGARFRAAERGNVSGPFGQCAAARSIGGGRVVAAVRAGSRRVLNPPGAPR